MPDRQNSRSSRPLHARLQAFVRAANENNSLPPSDGVIRASKSRNTTRRTGAIGRASWAGLHCDSMGTGKSGCWASERPSEQACARSVAAAANAARAAEPMMRHANRCMNPAPQNVCYSKQFGGRNWNLQAGRAQKTFRIRDRSHQEPSYPFRSNSPIIPRRSPARIILSQGSSHSDRRQFVVCLLSISTPAAAFNLVRGIEWSQRGPGGVTTRMSRPGASRSVGEAGHLSDCVASLLDASRFLLARIARCGTKPTRKLTTAGANLAFSNRNELFARKIPPRPKLYFQRGIETLPMR